MFREDEFMKYLVLLFAYPSVWSDARRKKKPTTRLCDPSSGSPNKAKVEDYNVESRLYDDPDSGLFTAVLLVQTAVSGKIKVGRPT